MPEHRTPTPTPSEQTVAGAPPTFSSVDQDTAYPHGLSSQELADLSSLLAPPQGAGELGRLAQYRVLKVLGQGGPKFASDEGSRQRFLREARAAAKLNHDHVVRIHQVGEERGIPFIAMEYLKGEPLDQFLKDKGELPIAQVLRIGREVAEGLQAAHAEGLVHRDIKPANIWLEDRRTSVLLVSSEAGQTRRLPYEPRVKILDFGLAREANDDIHLTKSGAVVGTPAYMSSEQAHGEPVDARTDLWSLGVLLYRLCTGKQPFTGPNTMAGLMAIGMEPPEPARNWNPQLPVPLEGLIHR
ncbi:MAG: serine/threonine protein kinase, partial [Planctomycetes bacterium]|nr:serine/threonine protein kinase [Planctomycetota bacterium]